MMDIITGLIVIIETISKILLVIYIICTFIEGIKNK